MYACIHIHAYVCMYVCMNMNMYIYMYVYIHTYMDIYGYTYRYIYKYMYTHMYMYMCKCMYMHLSTATGNIFWSLGGVRESLLVSIPRACCVYLHLKALLCRREAHDEYKRAHSTELTSRWQAGVRDPDNIIPWCSARWARQSLSHSWQIPSVFEPQIPRWPARSSQLDAQLSWRCVEAFCRHETPRAPDSTREPRPLHGLLAWIAALLTKRCLPVSPVECRRALTRRLTQNHCPTPRYRVQLHELHCDSFKSNQERAWWWFKNRDHGIR
jgi:hypothetical protein